MRDGPTCLGPSSIFASLDFSNSMLRYGKTQSESGRQTWEKWLLLFLLSSFLGDFSNSMLRYGKTQSESGRHTWEKWLLLFSVFTSVRRSSGVGHLDRK